MCGIIGIFNNKEKNSPNLVIKGLKILADRGTDGFGIAAADDCIYYKTLPEENSINIDSENALGHALHSVVGFVEQPVPTKKEGKESLLAANCEIYNWKELAKKYGLKEIQNDTQLLAELIEKKGIKAIEELDGVFAFAFWDRKNSTVLLARDILGEKPLWYSHSKGFAFASEKKALIQIGFTNIEEQNPREIIRYNIKTKKIIKIKRKFFSIAPEIKKPQKQIEKELQKLFVDAVKKRIPSPKISCGVLLSGGIDSTLIALTLKKLGVKPICYTAALEEKETGMNEAEDAIWARKAAKKLHLPLKTAKIKLLDIPSYLETIVPLIEDYNVVKVGVGLTFFAAAELAKKDKIKVIFSGLGSEELFAGYERHKNAPAGKINKECLSGLLKMYERDLYRDDVITMHNRIELRLPFLDKKLVEYSLKIPEKYKLDKKTGRNKIIIRNTAKNLGLPIEFAERKKRAAQYGSRFDKAIGKLAGKEKKSKSEYLMQFYKPNIMGASGASNVRLGVLFSSGKDSSYAMWTMKKQGYDISCLITIKSKNPDSYMFHTPTIDLAKLQAEAMEIPFLEQETAGEKEKELADLEKAIKKAKQKYGIEGIVTGALYSAYQRDRIEKICDNLGLKIFSPLWHIDQELEVKQLVAEGFEFIMTSIAAEGLDKTWLGKTITADEINELAALNKKIGLNIAGEGGEYESLVLDGPMFKKKIKIKESAIKEESKNCARMIVKKAILVNK